MYIYLNVRKQLTDAKLFTVTCQRARPFDYAKNDSKKID